MKKALLGLLVGFCICLVLATLAGETPLHVTSVLAKSAFGSWDDLALTLFYTTSLIFTGLAVCVAFHAGLFNIGAEGQLTMGTVAATAAALWLTPTLQGGGVLIGLLGSLLCIAVGAMVGGLWGWIPGYFKVTRNAHEVILTMMMNFIAAGLAIAFVTAHQNPQSQNPESAMVSPSMSWQLWDPIRRLAPDSPCNFSFVIAVTIALILGYLIRKSRWGFELRATGFNAEAAKMSGINSGRVQTRALLIGGALAAGVAMNEIFGSQMKYRLGFSPDYGFIGIAVALLARNNPWAVLGSAFLFGALQKGAGDLDLETTVLTRDFTRIMQAILILSVSSFSLWKGRGRWKIF